MVRSAWAMALAARWSMLALVFWLAGCSCNAELKPGPGDLLVRSSEPFFPWKVMVHDVASRLEARPGASWQISFDLEVDLRAHLPRHGRFKGLILAVFGDWRHDKDGQYRSGASNYALSTNFTTTGVPVQSFDHWPSLRLIHGKNGSPFEGLARFDLPRGSTARRHRFKGKLTVKVPADIPVGHYEPYLALLAEVEGVRKPVFLDMYSRGWKDLPFPALPLVAVGDAASPKIPWTAFSDVASPGRVGTLPVELAGKVALNIRTGFHTELILPPGQHSLRPGLPSVFPRGTLPPIVGGDDAFPDEMEHYLRLDRGLVACRVEGPGGKQDLPARQLAGQRDEGLALAGGPFVLDMRRTGTYRVRMTGQMEDRFGRKLTGGGTYKVNVALPLTFSTSCKPGSSFLVGGGYPGKVNLNPPVPGKVELTVRFYPGSDPARMRQWKARGEANRFGHFVPVGQGRMIFDEPGEYRSLVRATYRDRRGRLWMGLQKSSGVVAPQKPRVTLHGTRAFPRGLRPGEPRGGGVKRFDHMPLYSELVLFNRPRHPPRPGNAYDQRDTLFITTTGFNDLDLETRFAVSVPDDALARKLLGANTHAAVVLPTAFQRPGRPFRFLQDVLLRSKASGLSWLPATLARKDELPVSSVARGKLHPFAHPGNNRVDAYIYTSSIRPGFPAMTSVIQKDGLGLYWCTNPNKFGNVINSGGNGDLVGDVYRVMAGLVLKDRDTGKTYYDAYSSVIMSADSGQPELAVLAPGKRPLVEESGRKHHLFLATDTHNVLEVGERLGVGGMVFPNVPARVTWEITAPSGKMTVLRGRANRLGGVKGSGLVPVDEPGLYAIKVKVEHGGLTGGVVGTRGGTFWHGAVPRGGRSVLATTLRPMTRLRPRQAVEIPLQWSGDLRQVKLHFGVMMPGQVVEQGTVTPSRNSYDYRFDPMEASVRIPFLDVRDYGTGMFNLADTVVFQFLLEGKTADGAAVHDALRVVLRGDRLMSYGGGRPAPGRGP